jgi:hypothetical protein
VPEALGDTERAVVARVKKGGVVLLGLGRIVALHYPLSASYQIH